VSGRGQTDDSVIKGEGKGLSGEETLPGTEKPGSGKKSPVNLTTKIKETAPQEEPPCKGR